MGSITLAGRQIFILNENDRYPEPTINSPPLFAIREDEERQHWLYVWHKASAGRLYQMYRLKPRAKPLRRR
ncbi:hypothetical protein SME46J_13160 [Serratia marcescens]|nr:hypothetical protein SME46J_13160 [Serratia marcescens]